nr:hypothetical protein [Clostridia bacterium]
MQLFSLAELAAWLTRAAFWSIFLSSIAIKALVIPLGNGIIQDNLLRNVYFKCSFFKLNFRETKILFSKERAKFTRKRILFIFRCILHFVFSNARIKGQRS